MGGQLSTDALCIQEWDSYLKTTGKNKDEWDVYLDDSRNINIIHDTALFLAKFADIMETLLLGSKQVISERLHKEFADVTVKRMQELINFDFPNSNEKKFNKVVTLLRRTEDPELKRKTEMVLVMVVRITTDVIKKPEEEERATTHIESAIKVQVRSTKDSKYFENYGAIPPLC